MEGGYGLTGGWDSLWDWQTEEHCEPRDGSHVFATTESLCDFLDQDDDELGLLGNQTPLTDWCDFFADLGDITCKETLDKEEYQESKRRRTLEYPSESSQPKVGSHETASPFVTSKAAEVSLLYTEEPQSLNCDLQYTLNNLDTVKSMSNEAPYMQEDNHLEHCSYETPVYIEPDQVPCNREGIAYIDDQAGTSGTSEIAPMTETFIPQETRKFSTLKVSGNWRSTSIAYDFSLIKPFREKGDVTLQDINQRINAPPKNPEILGTKISMVGKTRINIEGGRGSITILRTRDD